MEEELGNDSAACCVTEAIDSQPVRTVVESFLSGRLHSPDSIQSLAYQLDLE